jgi:tRNA-Thr(GGU) m(6)t(6)A37 methyltransferase TsaA
LPGDAHLVFIGRVRSPWTTKADIPKNPREARGRGQTAALEIDPDFRPGLRDLERFSHIHVLAWLAEARRDLTVQQPRHLERPRGVFALRSPLRPNPIGLSVARVLSVDAVAGRVVIDAIDFLDGTPLLDIKPYLASIDSVADAAGP